MQKITALFLLILLCSFPLSAEPRSIDEIFSDLGGDIRDQIFSDEGYIASFERPAWFALLPSPGLDPQITGKITGRRPSVLVESLTVIPHTGGEPVTLVDVYNALGNIRDLKGRTYSSFTRKAEVPLFEDATRVNGPKGTSALQDPPDKSSIPPTETIYIRLKDINFGNSYYRGSMSLDQYGFLYSLTNYKDLSYLIFPVIKSEKFIAQFYFEPVAEGILIYSIAGADVNSFIASQTDMPSAIRKRLEVILSWAVDGIKSRG
ncbi:hypothetical protein AGMMS50268_01630 [Spirochaetia bacterium]|nr:hypothetical protein AGMMS50268_01630 [Spirochaetia bacterium]